MREDEIWLCNHHDDCVLHANGAEGALNEHENWNHDKFPYFLWLVDGPGWLHCRYLRCGEPDLYNDAGPIILGTLAIGLSSAFILPVQTATANRFIRRSSIVLVIICAASVGWMNSKPAGEPDYRSI